MIEYTLKTVSDGISARLKAAATCMLMFGIGLAIGLLVLALDKGSHLVLTQRDCHELNTFVADGVRYYCAPWIYEEPKP